MKRIGLTVLSLIGLVGCATSSVNYTPPVEQKINNTKQVNQSFDKVWDNLVKKLSSDFFVINNIDKSSRLINLSFTAATPSDYVDCGETRRVFKNARGEQVFDYKTADSALYTVTSPQSHAFNIKRVSRLEGRTNIYVAPESSGTLVSVNTKYVVNVNINAFNFVNNYPAGTENVVFDFSTKQGYRNSEVSCFAKGTIEKRILDLIGN